MSFLNAADEIAPVRKIANRSRLLEARRIRQAHAPVLGQAYWAAHLQSIPPPSAPVGASRESKSYASSSTPSLTFSAWSQGFCAPRPAGTRSCCVGHADHVGGRHLGSTGLPA